MYLNDLKHTLANTVQAAAGALREAGHVELDRRLTFEARSLLNLVGQQPERAVVRTAQGKSIDLLAPDLSVYGPGELVDEIVWALARLPRFAAHAADPDGFYSVGQHSLLVAHILSASAPECPEIWGLLHDAHEVWMGDVIAPVKALCGNLLRPIETALDEAVRDHLGLGPLPYLEAKAVKAADGIALALEQRYFFGDPGHAAAGFGDPFGDGVSIYRSAPDRIAANMRAGLEQAIEAAEMPAAAKAGKP